ncbi:MAG: DNA-binding protein [Burkholderiales bacterium]|nr:MAG: DNA-binding protein [Burkholderiales bacterium]
MTTDELAAAYFEKARKRIRVLEVLLEQEAYSDVVREAQELVELALKGMLRWVGIDPPKWHDVGPILLENQDFFAPEFRPRLPRLAEISLALRKERELAFYGDRDFIPTRVYSAVHGQQALSDARFVVECIGLFESLHRPQSS